MKTTDPLLFLALDDHSLGVKKHLCYYLTKPEVREEPVLVPEPLDSIAPDNLAAMFYGTVLQENGKFRMWYHACHTGENPDWAPDMKRQLANYRDSLYMGPVCYAESDDGLTWHKPALGQVLFKGTRENNALDLPHTITGGAAVIRDQDDPDPERRYKMVYQFFPRPSDPPFEEYGRIATIATAISSDGLHWKVHGIPYLNQFVEHCSFYRHEDRYIVGYQTSNAWGSHYSDGGHDSGRIGQSRFSYDFDNWIDGFVESLALPEPREPSLRGGFGRYAQNHLGIAPASYGNVCIGVYGIWHAEAEYQDTHCDLGLAISNDGLTFREPVKGHVFLSSIDSAVMPDPARHFHTNLCQGNGILTVGDETRIYHTRWRSVGHAHADKYYATIALASIPRDRWGALGLFPKEQTGTLWSIPVHWQGEGYDIAINAENAFGLRVELVDEKFRALPKYCGANAGKPASPAGLNIPIVWRERPVLAKGELVRLKVTFDRQANLDPRLFAINLAPR